MVDHIRKPLPLPYWHYQNPWKNTLIYVPIEELAEAINSTQKPEGILAAWRTQGQDLDAYILIPNNLHAYHISAGVRFGPNGSDYLSPYFNQDKLRKLIEIYSNRPLSDDLEDVEDRLVNLRLSGRDFNTNVIVKEKVADLVTSQIAQEKRWIKVTDFKGKRYLFKMETVFTVTVNRYIGPELSKVDKS